ncbi:MAG: oxidoreductase, partial [Phycisphaerae bacterium]
ALASLGLDLPQEVLVARQLFAVRAIDVPTGLQRHYARHYVNVDRGRFQDYLMSLTPPGVDVRPGHAFKAASRERGGFRITFVADGRSITEHARVLVAADGANSAVRRQLTGRRPWPKTYLTIQEWFEAPRPAPYFAAVFDPEVTDYYCWAIPKDDRLIVGAALWPARSALRRFELLKSRLAGFGIHLGRAVRREGGLLLRPTSTQQLCPYADGVALIGEAAGWVSPSSGEGISYALRSAAILAEAIHESHGDFAAGYLARCRALRADIRLKLLKCPLIYRPPLRAALLRSGLGAMRMLPPPVSRAVAKPRPVLR